MSQVLINTRPSGTSAITIKGVDVLPLPLLELSPKALTADDRLLLQQFLNAKTDVLTVVSQTAANHFLNFLKENNIHCANQLPHLPTLVVAVGKPTAKVLQDFGFLVSVPKQNNNEGMLALPQIQALNASAQVLICKGVGGRQVYADGLRALGMTVNSVDWYARLMPNNLAENFKQLSSKLKSATTSMLWIPITSQMSLDAWHSLDADSLLTDYQKIYLPMGERLYNLTHHLYPTANKHLIHRLDSEYLSKIIYSYAS